MLLFIFSCLPGRVVLQLCFETCLFSERYLKLLWLNTTTIPAKFNISFQHIFLTCSTNERQRVGSLVAFCSSRRDQWFNWHLRRLHQPLSRIRAYENSLLFPLIRPAIKPLFRFGGYVRERLVDLPTILDHESFLNSICIKSTSGS